VPAYAGLPVSRLAAVWFDYFTFAVMTIISGQTTAAPVSEAAQGLVLFNALWGVGLLVLLVTAFSMLTRDRARLEAIAAASSLGSAVHTLEDELFEAVQRGYRGTAISEEMVGEIGKIPVFRDAALTSYLMLRGMALVSEATHKLQAAGLVSETARILIAKATLTDVDLAELFRRVLAAGSDITATRVVEEIESIQSDRPELVDSNKDTSSE
jgi:hypothetical protein